MSRPMANNAPPTPPATPPPQDADSAAVTDNLTRTVGKGALQSGLAGGLGTITMVPMGGLVGGLVGVVYGSMMATTEGIREKYQPNGWGTNGVPPTYVPQQPVPDRQPSQRAMAVRNGGFPHGSPSQRKKQNPRAETVRSSGQKRMSSSPGPAPDRIPEDRPRATPRSKLNDSVSSPPTKRITSMTKLPPITSSIDPTTATPRTSRSPVSPSKRITSLSPIPKLNTAAAPISTPQAPPPESSQRKTLPSNPKPKPKSTTAPKVTPPTPKTSPAPPEPTPNSYPALNRNTSVSVLRPSLVPAPLKPAAPPAAISNTYPSLNRNTSISSLMPTAPEPAARSAGRRRRKGGANGSESSGSQAGDSRDSLQDRKLSIIDTYLG